MSEKIVDRTLDRSVFRLRSNCKLIGKQTSSVPSFLIVKLMVEPVQDKNLIHLLDLYHAEGDGT